jgi:hypothetical protein
MIATAVLLCTLGLSPDVSAETQASYEAKRTSAGRDAEKHVELAIWCGENGMAAEREKHLRVALLLDRNNAKARELLGLAPSIGQKEAAEKEAAATAALAEYNAKRLKAPKTADGQWDLALWCEKKGLKAEATAHLAEVVRLSPKREAAWKKLGYKKHDGRWMTDDQIREEVAQKKADRDWGQKLRAIHRQIHKGTTQDDAKRELAAIDDPRAVPAIYREFGRRKEVDQLIAIQALGQIKTRDASRALATLAVLGVTSAVRRSATESLRSRDPLDYLIGLIALIPDPLKYEVRRVGGPGSPGVLFVEGERFNVQRLYAPPAPSIAVQPTDFVTLDQYGMPVVTRFTPVGVPTEISNPFAWNPQAVLGPLSSALAKAGAPGASALRGINIPAASGPAFSDESKFAFQAQIVEQISLRQLAIEAQKAAISAQAQLDNDIQTVKSINTAREEIAKEILSIAKTASGKDLGDKPQAWRDWITEQAGSLIEVKRDKPKPTFPELVTLAYTPVNTSQTSIVFAIVPGDG